MVFGQVICVLFTIFLTVKGHSEFYEINDDQKLNISIYYESLCPDSVQFITKTFTPLYTDFLKPFVNVRLIPFGKSEVISQTEYRCQHGPEECIRNRLQACVLTALVDQDEKLKFVTYVMTYPALSDYEEIVTSLGFDWASVNQCANGPIGYMLMLKAQAETRSKTDGPSFVPSIVFNDVFNKDESRTSFTNPLLVVCKKLKVKPSFCDSGRNVSYLPTF